MFSLVITRLAGPSNLGSNALATGAGAYMQAQHVSGLHMGLPGSLALSRPRPVTFFRSTPLCWPTSAALSLPFRLMFGQCLQRYLGPMFVSLRGILLAIMFPLSIVVLLSGLPVFPNLWSAAQPVLRSRCSYGPSTLGSSQTATPQP